MKKLFAIILSVMLLFSVAAVTASADTASDISLARQKSDYADYFFDGFTVDYVRNFVCGVFVDEEDELYDQNTHTITYASPAVDQFMEDHFVFTDAMFAEVREALGYDAQNDVYKLPFIGGFGGMCKEREYVSYVKNSDNTYSLYYQNINWSELPSSEYEKMEAEDNWPASVVYNGKTYESTADGYLCKEGYNDGGLVHTLDIKDGVARFISTKSYTGTKVTAASTKKPTTTVKTGTTTNTVTRPTDSTTVSTTVFTAVSTTTNTTALQETVMETVAQTEGVVLQTAENVFPTGSVVKVEKITESAPAYQTVVSALKPISQKFVAYDVTATKDNVTVQPNGTVTATFDLPADFDAEKVVVLYVSDDGKVEELPTTVDKTSGKVTATLSHFSTYVIAEKVAADTVVNTEECVEQGFPWIILVIAVVVLAIAGVAVWYFCFFKKAK